MIDSGNALVLHAVEGGRTGGGDKPFRRHGQLSRGQGGCWVTNRETDMRAVPTLVAVHK